MFKVFTTREFSQLLLSRKTLDKDSPFLLIPKIEAYCSHNKWVALDWTAHASFSFSVHRTTNSPNEINKNIEPIAKKGILNGEYI